MTNTKAHKSGFVNIVGLPNTGKSTLMNKLLKTKMSIISPKPQTTRHRILGLINEDDYQIVLSDTPGLILKPNYAMHERMNNFVRNTFEDADLFYFMIDVTRDVDWHPQFLEDFKRTKAPKFLVLNKIDAIETPALAEIEKKWQEVLDFDQCFHISALEGDGVDALLEKTIEFLPEGPAYYPKDYLSDRPEKFFVSEIIREKIFLNYKEEIPYSTNVAINSYVEKENIDVIEAYIIVNRSTQKSILIGKNGSMIKKLGIEARKDIEEFLGRRVYLELIVKVREKWRDDENQLNRYGY